MSKETWIFDEVEKHSKKKKLPNVGLEVVTKIGNKLVEKKKNLAKEEERLKFSMSLCEDARFIMQLI